MKIFITGITGFTGRYLLHHLKDIEGNALQIFGLVRNNRTHINGFSPVYGDISDPNRMNEIIDEISPDYIFHLAGLTHGSLSELLGTNIIGTANLIDAILHCRIKTRIVIIGSSAEYGYQGEKPIREDAMAYPVSYYGISKLAQTRLSLIHNIKGYLNICICRPFNLIGPGQRPEYVCGYIMYQVARMKKNGDDRIHFNGVDERRDYIDVRDVVRAYWMIASSPNFDKQFSGEIFNVGSGIAYSVRDIIGMLEIISGITIQYSFKKEEPSYIPVQVSDCRKLFESTGWKPDISIKRSLINMFEYEREQL